MSLPAHSRQRSFIERLQGAITLDAATYAEIEHDRSAISQAAVVVALASAATAASSPVHLAYYGVIGLVIGGMITWAVSTAFVFLVGVRLMKHNSDYGELLRTLGFAWAPHMIGVLAVISQLNPIASWVAAGLGMMAYVVALREALDVTTRQAILVAVLTHAVIISTAIAMILLVVFAAGFGTAVSEPSLPRL